MRDLRRGESGRDGLLGCLLCVLCEPDGGEMAPSEFPDYEVASVGESVADVDWVVAPLDVVLPVLLVFSHDGMRVRRVV